MYRFPRWGNKLGYRSVRTGEPWRARREKRVREIRRRPESRLRRFAAWSGLLTAGLLLAAPAVRGAVSDPRRFCPRRARPHAPCGSRSGASARRRGAVDRKPLRRDDRRDSGRRLPDGLAGYGRALPRGQGRRPLRPRRDPFALPHALGRGTARQRDDRGRAQPGRASRSSSPSRSGPRSRRSTSTATRRSRRRRFATASRKRRSRSGRARRSP